MNPDLLHYSLPITIKAITLGGIGVNTFETNTHIYFVTLFYVGYVPAP